MLLSISMEPWSRSHEVSHEAGPSWCLTAWLQGYACMHVSLRVTYWSLFKCFVFALLMQTCVWLIYLSITLSVAFEGFSSGGCLSPLHELDATEVPTYPRPTNVVPYWFRYRRVWHVQNQHTRITLFAVAQYQAPLSEHRWFRADSDVMRASCPFQNQHPYVDMCILLVVHERAYVYSKMVPHWVPRIHSSQMLTHFILRDCKSWHIVPYVSMPAEAILYKFIIESIILKASNIVSSHRILWKVIIC